MSSNKNKSLKRVEKLYDERIYSNVDAVKAAGQWGSKELVPEICEEIGKKLGIKKDDKILEVGCGSGVLGNWAAKRCYLYCGLDISLMMIKKFRDEYRIESDYNLIQSITDAIPFRDNFFDIIIINGVTMYLHDKTLLVRTLNEMERVANDNATIFIGENVIPNGIYWEYSWFQNLSKSKQIFAKPYIKLRIWLAKNNTKFAGKWRDFHRDISPKFIKNYFKGRGKIFVSNAAAMTIKRKKEGQEWKGNRRIDFLIRLHKNDRL